MKKYVPLINVVAEGGSTNTFVEVHGTLRQTKLGAINSTYDLNYDPVSGTLNVKHPDTKITLTSGFHTFYTIGMGESGYRGNDGADGTDGNVANDGADGKIGLRGETGPRGYQGDVGGRGLRGPKGRRGPFGQQGMRGDIGKTGVDGAQGYQGDTGYPGVDADLLVVFSDYEPRHRMRDGAIWNQIVPRVYSGLRQSTCGSSPFLSFNAKPENNLVYPTAAAPIVTTNDGFSPVAKEYAATSCTLEQARELVKNTGVWKIVTLTKINVAQIDTMYATYKDIINFDCLNGKVQYTVRNNLIALLVEEYYGAPTLDSNFIDTFTNTVFTKTESKLVWRRTLSSTTVAWNTVIDPLCKTIALDTKAMTFKIIEPDYKCSKDESIMAIFFDRAGKCPGTTMENFSYG